MTSSNCSHVSRTSHHDARFVPFASGRAVILLTVITVIVAIVVVDFIIVVVIVVEFIIVVVG